MKNTRRKFTPEDRLSIIQEAQREGHPTLTFAKFSTQQFQANPLQKFRRNFMYSATWFPKNELTPAEVKPCGYYFTINISILRMDKLPHLCFLFIKTKDYLSRFNKAVIYNSLRMSVPINRAKTENNANHLFLPMRFSYHQINS